MQEESPKYHEEFEHFSHSYPMSSGHKDGTIALGTATMQNCQRRARVINAAKSATTKI